MIASRASLSCSVSVIVPRRRAALLAAINRPVEPKRLSNRFVTPLQPRNCCSFSRIELHCEEYGQKLDREDARPDGARLSRRT